VNGQRMFLGVLLVGLLLSLAVGMIQAQGPQPEDDTQAGDQAEAAMDDVIPVQGRLTDDSGNPLNGTYSIRFSIYNVSTGGTALCVDVDDVQVTNGLFNAHMDYCENADISGEQLWLGVKVGSDPEMTPRQAIYAVPYAWSLRPGAMIIGDNDPVLFVRTNSTTANSRALEGYASATGAQVYGVKGTVRSSSNTAAGVYGDSWATSGVNYGVWGVSASADGRGVYGKAESTTATGRPSGVFGYAAADRGMGVFGRSDGVDGYGGFFVNHDIGGDLIASNDYTEYGELEFRVSNNGGVYADLGYYTPAADFAELLPAVTGLEPGDVLVIGPNGQLARSTEACQPTVAGVYSTNPGFVGGSEDDKVLSEMDLAKAQKVPLAVVGVVPVKSSAENGSINPGDLLVASSRPGHAMKAGSGPAIGTVIGKALEGLDEGTGIIKMLVMLH
jgi:hypothetical protein